MVKSLGGRSITSKELKPGDVIFSHSDEKTSVQIRTLSRPHAPDEAWSHVAFVVAPNIRFEAPERGKRAGFYARKIEALVTHPNGGYAARIHESQGFAILRKSGVGEEEDGLAKFWSAVEGLNGLYYPRALDWIQNIAVGLRHLALGRLSRDAKRLTVFCSQAVYLILTTQHTELKPRRVRDMGRPTALFEHLVNEPNNWKNVTPDASAAQRADTIPKENYGPLDEIQFETARLTLKLNDILRHIDQIRRYFSLIEDQNLGSAESRSELPKSEEEFKAVSNKVFCWWEDLHNRPSGASLDDLGMSPMMLAIQRGEPYRDELPDGTVFIEIPGRKDKDKDK